MKQNSKRVQWMIESPMAQFFLNGPSALGAAAVIIPVIVVILAPFLDTFPSTPNPADLRAVTAIVVMPARFECHPRRRKLPDLRLDVRIGGKPVETKLESSPLYCTDQAELNLASLRSGNALTLWVEESDLAISRPLRVWQINRNERTVIAFDDTR